MTVTELHESLFPLEHNILEPPPPFLKTLKAIKRYLSNNSHETNNETLSPSSCRGSIFR